MSKVKYEGFIFIHRKFKNWEWYDDPPTRLIFEHCLYSANFIDEVWKGQEIKRGQFPTSIEKLATANGLTIRQTRTALKNLQMTNEITVQTTNRYSIITVNNWDLYQPKRHAKRQTKDTPNDMQNDMPSDNTIINKEYNKRDINKLISLSGNERDLLKNYLLSKSRKEPIYDFDAYLSVLIKNKTIFSKLEKAKQWQERQEQKKLKVVTPPIEQEQSTPEDEQRGIELLRDTVKKIKKGA